MSKETSAKAPGKLMICGEWSVLQCNSPEYSCVVVPVDKYLTCTINSVFKEEEALLDCPDMKFSPIPLLWNNNSSCLEQSPSSKDLPRSSALVLSAIRVASRYVHLKLNSQTPLPLVSVTVRSDISSSSPSSGLSSASTTTEKRDARLSESKPGLGSSSAVVVAVISCFLKHFLSEQESPLCIYKLSAIAQILSPDHKNGSAFDIAAASFRVPIFYRRFDPEWLSSTLETMNANKDSLTDLVDGKVQWPRLSIDPIPWPHDTCELLVCFSRKSVSSAVFITKVRSVLVEGGERSEKYLKVMKDIGVISEAVRDAFREGRPEAVPELLKRNRALLLEAQEIIGVEFESPELAAISDAAEKVAEEMGKGVFVGAKFSGSGGGDNGIAIVVSKDPELRRSCCEKIITKWKSLGFLPLDNVALLGV